MPIYDYVCRSCGHVLEVIHGVHDAGPSACPVCGGEMRRAVSAAAVVFKGSGWAKKERSSKASPASAKEGESEKRASTSDSTAKPAESTSSEAS